MTVLCGIVLAAGAGRRYGAPKALVRGPDGVAWIARAVDALRAGGCDHVLVGLGAEAAAARGLVPRDAEVVVVADWADGVSATLRATLAAASVADADAAVIVPVDTPGMPAAAVARLVRGAGRASLRQADHSGVPGHPVVLGRDHWSAVARAVAGDAGAGRYLAAHGAERVPCADLWDGADIDTAPRVTSG